MTKFYDTSSLLLKGTNLFNQEEKFAISSITLKELENIKTSANKDPEIKFAARRLLASLDEHQGAYDVHIFTMNMLEPIIEKDLLINDDAKILACAIDYNNKIDVDDTYFVTNDLSLKNIANLFFGDGMIESIGEIEEYSGYKEYILTDDELSDFYSNMNYNFFNLLINEYIIIRNEDEEVIDQYYWDGIKHKKVRYNTYTSRQLGVIKPYKNDTYQLLALDSLDRNDVTMLCGKAGSGKTYIALGYLFSLLEDGIIDKIVVFCNPVVAKNAAKLGFYPGTVEEKLLSTQVGAVLSSKLGSDLEVQNLMEKEKLVLIPAGDARGYEVPPHSGVYIMESQNLTCDLLRMLLQRVSEGSKVIIDGDYTEQVDMEVYAGANNGMRKASEVFRGSDIYGQVELQNIYRSKIANLAELMK